MANRSHAGMSGNDDTIWLNISNIIINLSVGVIVKEIKQRDVNAC